MPKLKIYNNTTRIPYLGEKLDKLFYDLGFIYTGMTAQSLFPSLYLPDKKNKVWVSDSGDSIKIWDGCGSIQIHINKSLVTKKIIIVIIQIAKQNSQ